MISEQPLNNSLNKTCKRWKKTFLIVIAVLVSFTFLIIGTAWLMENKLKAKIVAEINKQLKVPVKVGGEISLSIVKHCPDASLTFEKVSIDDMLSKGSKKLIQAEEISFLCNIYSLFGNEIEFSKIVVREGELNMYKDESGKTNFDILKPQKQDGKDKVSVRLKRALIKKVRFTYRDRTQATNIDLKLNNASLKGNFHENNFDLNTEGNIHVNSITANGEEFLADKNISAAITLQVDKAKQKYNFKKGKLTVEENEFSITGFWASLKNETQEKKYCSY